MKRTRKPETECTSPECEEFEVLLTEYWENESDPELRAEIEEHSRTCPHCAEIYRSYQITIQTFRSSHQVPVPDAIHRAFWDHINRELKALKEYLK